MKDLGLKLSDASGVPRYRQIVDQLAEQIRVGRLRSGDKLPSVRELAPRLVVSLITVRKAYEDLEADGLIVRRQGQGSFVAENVSDRSQRRARQQARALLDEAVHRALRLGLNGDQVLAHVGSLLDRRR